MKKGLFLLLAIYLGFFPSVSFGYIDPNTTHVVLSGLGAILGLVVTGILFAWFTFKRFARAVGEMLYRTFFRGQYRWFYFGFSLTIFFCLCIGVNYLVSVNLEKERALLKRTVIIGIDGLDPKIAKRLMAEGKMPTFSKISQNGHFSEFTTINPPQSPVVWTTIATGAVPSIHGIADFISKKEKTYQPDLAILKYNPNNYLKQVSSTFVSPVDSNLFFWNILSKNHVSAETYRWPLTFPAAGSSISLSGLGTPDILGGLGRYTVFSSNPEAFDREIKGNIKNLQFIQNRATSKIDGPAKTNLLTKETSSEIPINFTMIEDKILIEVQEQKYLLASNQWSDWISLDFSIGFGNRVPAIAKFLIAETSPDIHIYMTPLQIDPTKPAFKITEPEELSGQLTEHLGKYATMGMPEDTNALSDNVINEDQFNELAESIMKKNEEMFFLRFSQFKSGIFSFVFDATDRIQHVYWRFIDEKHPRYDAEGAKKYGKVIEAYYLRMDSILKKAWDMMDQQNDLLLVFSDHGFSSYRRSFHVNSWLIKEGYMVLNDNNAAMDGLFNNVNWAKTKAFALGFSQIFINLKDREKNGVVNVEEAKRIKHEITEKLKKLVDERDGLRPVEDVYHPEELYGLPNKKGPDLIIGMNEGYRFSWQTAVGGAPAFLFEDNLKAWSGDHCIDAKFVPGTILSNKKMEKKIPSVLDIAPTVLSFYNIAPPPYMSGKNLLPKIEQPLSKNTVGSSDAF